MTKFKKNSFPYKSHLNSSVKVTKADGTVEVQQAMTGYQIAQVIKESSSVKFKMPRQDTKVVRMASDKQLEYLKSLGYDGTLSLTINQASSKIKELFTKSKKDF
jgi:hypothetical protein